MPCDGSVAFRGAAQSCTLPAGHDGACRTAGGLTFRRITPAWAAGDLAPDLPPVSARESRRRTRKREPKPAKKDGPALPPEECRCSKCGSPCAACSCPRDYKRSAANLRYEARNRGRSNGHVRALNAERRAAGICITCGKEPADGEKGGARCPGCVAKGAANAWRGRQVRRVLRSAAWQCAHSSDGEACPDCRRCVASYIRAHEVEIRARVRSMRPDKIAAAAAARDAWSRDHEGAAAD